MKPIYRMSEAGVCSRVLVAQGLGYEPLARDKTDVDRLNYYSRLEAVAAQQILDLGYRLEPSLLCQICKDRYGTERHGIHVEIDTPLFQLIGHLDRRIIPDDSNSRFPVEIKSLGRFAWTKFSKERFGAFPQYAGQEICYLEAERKPGIYWVLNRDTGEPQKYVINDSENELDLEGFERLELPITFDQIVDKLNQVEVYVSSGELPEGEESDSCIWCRYKYLCSKPDDKDKKIKVIDIPDLSEAARTYREGLDMEKIGKEMKDSAAFTLLNHAKTNNENKFRVGNVSFTYSGQRTRKWLDELVVRKELPPEIIKLAERESKPYDSYTIRVLKEEK